jgi:hypothetical protein
MPTVKGVRQLPKVWTKSPVTLLAKPRTVTSGRMSVLTVFVPPVTSPRSVHRSKRLLRLLASIETFFVRRNEGIGRARVHVVRVEGTAFTRLEHDPVRGTPPARGGEGTAVPDVVVPVSFQAGSVDPDVPAVVTVYTLFVGAIEAALMSTVGTTRSPTVL